MALSDQVYEESNIQLQNQETEDPSDYLSSDDVETYTAGHLKSNRDNPVLSQCKMRSGKIRFTKCLIEASTQNR